MAGNVPKLALSRDEVIEILLEAEDPKASAAKLGIPVADFLRLAKQAAIQNELRNVNAALGGVAAAKIGASGQKAVAVLVSLMEDPDTQDAVRMGAARELLERHEKWVEREDLRKRLDALERRQAEIEREAKKAAAEAGD